MYPLDYARAVEGEFEARLRLRQLSRLLHDAIAH
jgi:hypothetical protein